MLKLGIPMVAGCVPIVSNTPSKGEVGRELIAADIAARGGALAGENAHYTLNNLELRCVRYHMGPEFDIAEANVLQVAASINHGFQIILFQVDDQSLLKIKQPPKGFQYQPTV